jgi:hypothetical protein
MARHTSVVSYIIEIAVGTILNAFIDALIKVDFIALIRKAAG